MPVYNLNSTSTPACSAFSLKRVASSSRISLDPTCTCIGGKPLRSAKMGKSLDRHDPLHSVHNTESRFSGFQSTAGHHVSDYSVVIHWSGSDQGESRISPLTWGRPSCCNLSANANARLAPHESPDRIISLA